jgi:hypothetical protein
VRQLVQPLRPAVPRSSVNIAHTGQAQAAMTPSDTSVSMVSVPCRRFFSAAWWNGQADHSATGAVQPMRAHCQPGKRTDGISDRSVSGTKNTSARISRCHR